MKDRIYLCDLCGKTIGVSPPAECNSFIEIPIKQKFFGYLTGTIHTERKKKARICMACVARFAKK